MMDVFIANPKGGCGKSTIAISLASYFASQGDSVCLVDYDPQRSTLDWLKARPKACASILPSSPGFPLPDQPLDWVVHDLPAGFDIPKLEALLPQGARVLVPILPSPTDIKAGVRFLMGLSRADWMAPRGIKVGLIANRVRTNTRYYRVLLAFLQQVNRPLLCTIRDTQNYVRTMETGTSIFDLPTSKVMRDIEDWAPLVEWLKAALHTETGTPEVAV